MHKKLRKKPIHSVFACISFCLLPTQAFTLSGSTRPLYAKPINGCSLYMMLLNKSVIFCLGRGVGVNVGQSVHASVHGELNVRVSSPKGDEGCKGWTESVDP